MKDYQSKQEAKQSLKRYGISLLIALPILFLVGFLLRNANKTFRICVFLIILAIVFVLMELIYRHKLNKNDNKPKQDVFK